MKIDIKIDNKHNWIAEDRNGFQYFYHDKPYLEYEQWHYRTGWAKIMGIKFDLGNDYKKSLHKINHETGEFEKYIEKPDLKVDDRILVRDSNSGYWIPRHFSHWNGNLCMCFDGGKTSWSENGCGVYPWEHWKLPDNT